MASIADEIALGIERLVSESSLRESDRKYRAIIEQTFQLFGIVSVDGILIDSNRAALEGNPRTLRYRVVMGSQ